MVPVGLDKPDSVYIKPSSKLVTSSSWWTGSKATFPRPTPSVLGIWLPLPHKAYVALLHAVIKGVTRPVRWSILKTNPPSLFVGQSTAAEAVGQLIAGSLKSPYTDDAVVKISPSLSSAT